MKPYRSLSILAFAFSLALTGCSKKQVDTSQLEKAFQSVPPSKAAPNRSAQADPVKQMADQALTAIKANNYEAGAVALQALRSSPTLNPDQLTAVQDAMAAFQKQLVERADRGDANAKKALETIGAMRRR